MRKLLTSLTLAFLVAIAPSPAHAAKPKPKPHASAHPAKAHPAKHAAGPHLTAARLRDQQQALQNQQQQLAEKLGTQRAHAQALKKKEMVAVGELTTLQQKLETTSTELQDSQYRLQRAQDKLSVAQGHLAQAREEFEVQQHAAGSRLRAMYKNQALDQWESMLAAPDMTSFLTRYHYFKRIGDHDAALLDQLDRQREAVRNQQHEYASQRQSIARITEVIGSQKIQLTDMTHTKADMVTQIKTERQAAEQVVAQLEADSSQIESMIRRMMAQRKALEDAARVRNPHYIHFLGTGRFGMPVANAVMSSPFGYRMHPILHRMILHAGIDFAVASGTPIYAPDSGECIYAGWYGGYGKVVIIDHGGDLTTLYGHTSSYVVGSGQRIKKGQLIAYSGSTGMSTGPHLHFEVRKNGTPVNPLQYLH